MQKIITALRGLWLRILTVISPLWARFRTLPKWAQIVSGIVLAALIIGLIVALASGKPVAQADSARTVSVKTVAELSNGTTGGSVIGTVRSRSEAALLAESSGMVRRVNTSIGASVPAGFVIAELDNDAQRAAVLQAEGAYDAAVASRASVSPLDAATTARNAYKDAYSTLDTTVTTYLDAFYGGATAFGPSVQLTRTLTDRNQLSAKRTAISDALRQWQAHLAAADATDPATLLDEADRIATQVQSLTEELARSANDAGSGATTEQLTALAAARSGVNGVLSSLSSARATWRSNSTGSTASVDAGVKSALGTLRLAQASLENTIVRAPIAGTVNFLPVRVGDYVTQLMHVATVAQNGALEIVAFLSEEARAGLVVGSKVMVNETESGVITSIAPALDPSTKQIEMHVAVESTSGSTLVNGQSVRIGLPSAGVATTTASGPTMLPLSAVKLATNSRVVFTVGPDSHLIAIPVEIGDVRGEKIEVLSPLPADTRIVTDARGLSEGQEVKIAE